MPGRGQWSSSRNRNIQARVDARYLAIIAEHFNRKGLKIRSISELCRHIIEEYAHERVKEGARVIESGDEADAILEFTGMPRGGIPQSLFPDTSYQSIYPQQEEVKKETPIQGPYKKPYIMSEEEIKIFNMNAKFLDPNQSSSPEPRNYEPLEGEYDDLRGGKELRPKTLEEMVELENFVDEMNEWKRRDMTPGRSKKEREELAAIHQGLMAKVEDFKRRGLME